MASHAGFHDVGAFPQSFESFPFLYVQIPFSHFCCISPESDPVAIQKHQPQVSSVPQICRRKLPNDAISHRLRKSWTQIMSRIRSNRHVSHPPLGKPFVVSHTHTHHLLRSLYGVLRTPTFTGCRLMWGVIWVPKSSIKHHQAAHAWAPGSGGLGTHTTVPLGALLKYHARLNAFYIPYHPSDWNIYLHFSWFLW